MKIFFPYDFREGQREAVELIADNIGEKNICMGASTGFGKTSVILSALLSILKPGEKIIWLSKTAGQTQRPVEELQNINSTLGTSYFGLSFRGKKEMCLLIRDKQKESEEEDERGDVNYFCQVKKKSCRYFKKLQLSFFEDFVKGGPKSFSEILEFAKENGICPYYMQQKLIDSAHLISINYRQVIDKNLSHAVEKFLSFDESYLVVDEAHNLQALTTSINSKKFSVDSINFAVEEALSLKEKDSRYVANYLEGFRRNLITKLNEYGVEEEFDMKKFFSGIEISSFASVLETCKDYGNKYKLNQIAQGKAVRSSLSRFHSFWSSSMESVGMDGISFIVDNQNVRKGASGHQLELFDMRSKEVLGERWPLFRSAVFTSGTLEPMEDFAEVIGLEDYRGKTFQMKISPDNIGSFVVKGLTTKGESFSDEMVKSYLKSIESFVRSVDRNLVIFTSSYRIQNSLIDGVNEIGLKYGRNVFSEYQGLEGKDAEKMLNSFRRCAKSVSKGILCASMQGRFSEGIDLPGDELDGVFVVGIPFDSLSLRTKLSIRYYEKIYGTAKGRKYSYVIPALRKVSQCLGRALRSQDDKVVFVLGDERYLYPNYWNLLPKFVQENSKVVTLDDMESEIGKFSKVFDE